MIEESLVFNTLLIICVDELLIINVQIKYITYRGLTSDGK